MKTNFYFSVLVLLAVGVIQSMYCRKLNVERRTETTSWNKVRKAGRWVKQRSENEAKPTQGKQTDLFLRHKGLGTHAFSFGGRRISAATEPFQSTYNVRYT